MTSSNSSTATHSLSIKPNRIPFSDEEKNIMLTEHDNYTMVEMAEKLGRPIPSVRYFYDTHRIKAKPAQLARWEPWQTEVLVMMFKDTHPRDLAVLVGRSEGAVMQQAHKLHLYKSREFTRQLYQEGYRKRVAAGWTPHFANGGHSKPIIVTDTDGNIVRVFPMSRDCCNYYKMHSTQIRRTCQSITHRHRQLPHLRFWFLKDYNEHYHTNITTSWK